MLPLLEAALRSFALGRRRVVEPQVLARRQPADPNDSPDRAADGISVDAGADALATVPIPAYLSPPDVAIASPPAIARPRFYP
jgi:hypothetical protein